MSETWDGPGDGWYPGDDDDEEFKLDQAEAAGIDRDAAREALHYPLYYARAPIMAGTRVAGYVHYSDH